jgi:anti-sigma28 factor (negative regulator of flagellin synthesis)
MKIKDTSHYHQVGLQKYGKGSPQAEQAAQGEQTRKDEAVQVRSSRSLAESISPEQIQTERNEKVAQLKALVQSGNYFKERDMGDIAKAVVRGLDEEVRILKRSVPSSEEE